MARDAAQVTLERVTRAGYVVGVRLFVASEAEQRAVERAIAAIARQEQDAQAHLTAPTP